MPQKPRTIRFPDHLDDWIESQVTTYRSFSSLVIEMAEKAFAASNPKLQDKQRTGSLRKG